MYGIFSSSNYLAPPLGDNVLILFIILLIIIIIVLLNIIIIVLKIVIMTNSHHQGLFGAEVHRAEDNVQETG